MKQHEIQISGKVTKDGKLAMYMAELNQFTKQWPNARIIATFRVSEPGTSAALKGYYYNYIVPTFKRAIWNAGERKTDEQVERYLREISPIMYEQIPDPKTGIYHTELRKIKDLDNSELIEHIEHLKQIGAEEFSIYIEDPNTYECK